MRKTQTIAHCLLPIAYCLLPLATIALDPRLTASIYGDARYAVSEQGLEFTGSNGIPGTLSARLPYGEWNNVTVTVWLRCTATNPAISTVATVRPLWAVYCPEPIQSSAPDLLSGACGYPAGTNFEGTASFAHTFTAEGGSVPANVFAKGAYTVAGWSSNAVTVTLGGAAMSLGPGEFNRNALPGDGTGITVGATGAVAVGVSRLHAHQYFNEAANHGSLDNLTMSLTNELVLCAYRIRLDASLHVLRFDILRKGENAGTMTAITNALPDDPSVRGLSSSGDYRFGAADFSAWAPFRMDVFDGRVFTRWLTDAELGLIFSNGDAERTRRGVTQWR